MIVQAVLFDLDGTLADTAPDLTLALEALRPPEAPHLDAIAIRRATAIGSEALLRAGLGLTPEDSTYEPTRAAFLEKYEQLIGSATVLTPGMDHVIQTLDARGLRWGVVTNKAEALARRVLKALTLDTRAACVVGGDTMPRRKPFPDPLLRACALIHLEPAQCVYVGDDKGDVLAAHAAGMPAFAAAFGYTSWEEASTWGAEGVLATPTDLLDVLS